MLQGWGGGLEHYTRDMGLQVTPDLQYGYGLGTGLKIRTLTCTRANPYAKPMQVSKPVPNTIHDAWDALEIPNIDKYIDTKSNRVQAILEANGGHTRFWLYICSFTISTSPSCNYPHCLYCNLCKIWVFFKGEGIVMLIIMWCLVTFVSHEYYIPLTLAFHIDSALTMMFAPSSLVQLFHQPVHSGGSTQTPDKYWITCNSKSFTLCSTNL